MKTIKIHINQRIFLTANQVSNLNCRHISIEYEYLPEIIKKLEELETLKAKNRGK